jgi:hypothetical protein
VRTTLANKLRAVVLSFNPCREGFVALVGFLRRRDVYSLLREAQGDLAVGASTNLRYDFGWLLKKLHLPGGTICPHTLYNAGVRVQWEGDWRRILAYSQTIDQIVAAIERAYKALSPADRRRRTWAQRRKS